MCGSQLRIMSILFLRGSISAKKKERKKSVPNWILKLTNFSLLVLETTVLSISGHSLWTSRTWLLYWYNLS